MKIWFKGQRFVALGFPGVWEVIDFDYTTHTVLGLYGGERAQIFYFDQIRAALDI